MKNARTFIMAFINQREAEKQTNRQKLIKYNFKEYIEQNEAFLAEEQEQNQELLLLQAVCSMRL